MSVEGNGPLVRLPTFFNDYTRRWWQRPSCLWIVIGVQAVLCSFFFCGAVMPFAEAMRDSISKHDVQESRENFHAGENAFTSYQPDQLQLAPESSEPFVKRYFTDDDVYVTHVLDASGDVQYEMHVETVGSSAASVGRYSDAYGHLTPNAIRWQVLNKKSGDVFTLAPLDLSLGNHSAIPSLFYFSHTTPGQSHEERVLTFVSTQSGDKDVAFLGKGAEEWQGVQEFARFHRDAAARGDGRRLNHEMVNHEDFPGRYSAGGLVNHEMMAWCPMKKRYYHAGGPPTRRRLGNYCAFCIQGNNDMGGFTYNAGGGRGGDPQGFNGSWR